MLAAVAAMDSACEDILCEKKLNPRDAIHKYQAPTSAALVVATWSNSKPRSQSNTPQFTCGDQAHLYNKPVKRNAIDAQESQIPESRNRLPDWKIPLIRRIIMVLEWL